MRIMVSARRMLKLLDIIEWMIESVARPGHERKTREALLAIADLKRDIWDEQQRAMKGAAPEEKKPS